VQSLRRFTKGLKTDDLPDFHGSRDFYFTRNLIDNYIEDALRSTSMMGAIQMMKSAVELIYSLKALSTETSQDGDSTDSKDLQISH
jgi:hypothetical protein